MATLREQIDEQKRILGRSGRRSEKQAAQKRLDELNRQRVQIKVDQKKAKEEKLTPVRSEEQQRTFDRTIQRRGFGTGPFDLGEATGSKPVVETQTETTVDGTPDAKTADEIIMSTEEERKQALLDEPFRDLSETELELFGETQGPEGFAGVIEEEKARIERERAASEREADLQEQSIRDQAETAQRGAMQQVTAAEQVFGGVDREGPVDVTGARTGVQRFRDRAQRQLTRIEERRNAAFADVERFREDIIRAERAGNRELAGKYREALAAAENELVRMDTEYLNAIDKQRETGIQTLDNLTSALGASGIGNLSAEQLSPILQDAGIPGAFASAIIQANRELADAQAEGDELNIQIKEAQLAEMNQAMKDAGKTADQKKFDFYTGILNNPDASRAERAAAIEALGIEEGDLIPSSDSIFDAPKGPGENAILAYSQIYSGSSKNANGVDFAAKVGTPVNSQLSGEVIEVTDNCKVGDFGCNGGWGNQVKVRDNNGNIHTYNHLNNVSVSIGDVVARGLRIGQVGNTGDVLKGDGTQPNAEELGQGRGAHLDYTVFDPSGNMYSLNEAWQFANGTVSQDNGLYLQFLDEAKKQGLKGEKAEKFAEKRLDESYKPLTESQSKSLSAYNIMSLEDQNYDNLTEGLDKEEFANAINVLSRRSKDGNLSAELVNRFIDDPKVRQALLSEMRWIEAKLRKESGAAISISEYVSNGTAFFPRAGDDEETIKQKEQARKTSLESMYQGMGPAGQRALINQEAQPSADATEQVDEDEIYNESEREVEEEQIVTSDDLERIEELNSTEETSNLPKDVNLQA